MYEELVGLLRDYGSDCTGNDMCQDCTIQYWCENGWTPNDIADAIEELSKKYTDSEVDNINLTGWLAEEHAKHQWISAKERMPEPDELVLTCSFGTDVLVQQEGETLEQTIARTQKISRVYAGFVDEDGYWNSIDGFPMIIQPSYWMHFPEPPKEET